MTSLILDANGSNSGLDRPHPLPLKTGGVLYVRHVTDERHRQIRVECGLPAWPAPDEKLTPDENTRLNEALWLWMLEGWDPGTVTDYDGNDLKPTDEARLTLFHRHRPVRELVEAFSERVWGLEQARRGRELGNSHGSSRSADAPTPTEQSATIGVLQDARSDSGSEH